MSTKKTEAKKTDENQIDPNMTAPSKGDQDKDTATTTEPNSKQRLASRTGRGNGGGDAAPTRVGMRPEPDTLGEREGVKPSDNDLIWTNTSKDRWENGQPSLGALLKQHANVKRKSDEK